MNEKAKTIKYILIFIAVYLLGLCFFLALLNFANSAIPGLMLILPYLAASTSKGVFVNDLNRAPTKREINRLTIFSFLSFLVIHIPAVIFGGHPYPGLGKIALLMPDHLLVPMTIGLLLLGVVITYFAVRFGFGSETKLAHEQDIKNVPKEGDKTISENTVNPLSENKADAISISDERKKPQSSAAKVSDWQPPTNEPNYAIRTERAPWGRWILSGLLVATIVFGAGWLVSKVVTPGDLPNKPVAEQKVDERTQPVVKKSSDDEAWVKALEKDTLEGYREYLTLFPNGKHKDAAQAEIDKYDNKAWEIAEQRQTLAGYEDYLESWPEGLHASKAREKIAEIKARAEALAKDAAERAAQDAAHWDAAALANTVDSYGRYLAQQPRGKWVAEAQNRITQLQAAQAAAAASAADQQAWNAAKAANRADSYQQYITSYPQGTYVPQAIAAIEQLKPSPGRTFQDCQACPLMVSLPSGNANLGAGDGETNSRPNEKPQRPVTFTDSFAMAVHEVTFDNWQACVNGGGCAANPSNSGWGGGNRPVINVTWDQAQSYASWLSQTSGFQYSLPSEAQWEYAARGGKTDVYIGGSLTAICAFANGAAQESGLGWANSACTDLSSDRTQPVGLLSANGFGLKDMIGNVAEWTLDCNTLNLRDAPTDGRADQRGSCNQRAVRGGSWFSGPADMRYAARLMQRRTDSNEFTGFRVVRKTNN